MKLLVVEIAKFSLVKIQAEILVFDLTKLTETREEQWRLRVRNSKCAASVTPVIQTFGRATASEAGVITLALNALFRS